MTHYNAPKNKSKGYSMGLGILKSPYKQGSEAPVLAIWVVIVLVV